MLVGGVGGGEVEEIAGAFVLVGGGLREEGGRELLPGALDGEALGSLEHASTEVGCEAPNEDAGVGGDGDESASVGEPGDAGDELGVAGERGDGLPVGEGEEGDEFVTAGGEEGSARVQGQPHDVRLP